MLRSQYGEGGEAERGERVFGTMGSSLARGGGGGTRRGKKG